MTLTALAVAVFVGWRMKKADVRDELTNGGTSGKKIIFDTAYFIIKWIAPVMILVIFVSNFLS